MRHTAELVFVAWISALVWLPAPCLGAPPTAQSVVAKSVAAHGGDRLTAWKTLTIKGTVPMMDGIEYKAAYLLQAKLPGKVKVEQDMTADHGRAFYEYFLNDGVAWTRRNLVASSYDAARMKRTLDQCYGVAFYAREGTSLELRPDADVTWTPPPAAKGGAASPMTRGAFVVALKVGAESRELYIDRETYFLIKEVTPASTRIYWEFKPFEGVTWATRVLEVTKTRQGEQQTPFTFTSVTYKSAIADWIFNEDMPAKGAK